MSNTLKSMEKDLRAFAKRSKDVKYTKGLLLSFLLMGAISFAETLTSPQVKSTENAINQTKRDLNTSISDMHKTFKQTKRQNNKLLRNANLELIQLMEQGDQVIKIPWNTWQWGTLYTYNDWRDEYKGKGDKKEKYPFNGMLERDADEMNRYIPLDSENRSLLRTAGNVNSASTNLRQGLPQGYGIASTTLVKENPITVQVNAGITPRSVNKNSPANTPSAPTIILPAFEPRLTAPPEAPGVPVLPTFIVPTFATNVRSSGNGTTNRLDDSTASQGTYSDNGVIEMVALTSGNFKIDRIGPSQWQYEYTGYSGVNAWAVGNAYSDNPSQASVAAGGTWSNVSRSSTTSAAHPLGFQKLLGSTTQSTMLSNATFLYTRKMENPSTTLGEFVHLDIHGAAAPAGQRTGLVTATNGLSNASDILAAYDDAGDDINISTTNASSSRYTWINSGKIVIEGGNTSVTNHYDHSGVPSWKSIAMNTGNILFQPYFDGTN